MAPVTTSIPKNPHWRTVRTLTGEFPALVGPLRDSRVERLHAGPEVVIALPRFEGHMLLCERSTLFRVHAQPVGPTEPAELAGSVEPAEPVATEAVDPSPSRPAWAWPVLLLQGLAVLVLIGFAI